MWIEHGGSHSNIVLIMSFIRNIRNIGGYFSYGQCRYQRVLFWIMCFGLVLWFNVAFNKPVFHYYKNMDVKSACVIPKFNNFDSSISEFFWDVSPLQCESSEPIMYMDNDGTVRVNQSLKISSGYQFLNCTCQPVIRIDDDNITLGNGIRCTEPIYIPGDFIYAVCTNGGKQVYDGLLYGIDFKSVTNNKKFKNETENNLSVYFYGFDALSGLIAKRTMPLTMKYLEDVLEAYTFNGYTKVGDNTWPNLGGLLTGGRYEQVKKTFVEVPFIWNNFSQNGYVTMFSEEYPRLSCFKGFNGQPTDHLTNTFFVAAEKIKPIKNRDIRKILLFMEYKNIKVSDSSYLCIGNTPKHKIIINYYKRYIEAYKNRRKFGMSFNTELGHDYINFYNLADKDSAEFLKWMHETGNLDNAIFVFFSDHGPRYSEIQNTNIGRVTGLMPIFTVYVPKHIKQRYPQIHSNLLKNTERLTTVFDVHETLKDVIKSNFDHSEPVDKHARGISLFKPIPETRSCYDADIPEHYCPCYASEDIDVKNKRVQIMAFALVKKINKLLQSHADICVHLVLSNVIKASKVKSNFERDKSMEERFSIRSYIYNNEQDTRYLLVVETKPGNAKFEATVHYSSDTSMEVSGEISRINKYGNQSECINVKKLKLYCFCK
ncbi:uncharacterized protein LOC134725442 isoform X1 [Mytilus trossulus]|uniref:uncharacterized protein LOC134725442 isoform X1 n=2 Tax=Mytilus trossulus TaxID=6551 RepID=UPI003007596C